ncbi:MAG: ISKra4 family transposase [Anaerolineales bacterium]
MQKKHLGRGAEEEVILFAVPVQHKDLVAPIQALLRAAAKACTSAVGGRAVDYAAIEREIAERTAAIESATHASILRGLDVDAERLTIGGKPHVRIGRARGTYKTLAGSVEVERAVYRPQGVRNAPVADTIQARTGAIGRGWLPMTARAMADDIQRSTSRDAKAGAKQKGRLPYGRMSFERVAHLVGEDWQSEHVDIEEQLAKEYAIPEAARSISVALDRVSVPMEEPAKRPIGRPRKNAPKRPVNRNFRMAYCGTVTLHDGDGKALNTFRRACMPEIDPNLLCGEMAAEVFHLKQNRSDLKLKLLADGAHDMWNLLEPHFPESVFGKVERGLDFYHVIEKLSPAAKAIYGNDKGAVVLRLWRHRLKSRSDAAAQILDDLQASGCEHKTVDSKKPVHEAITYFEYHLERMDFAASRRTGLPIGSGGVEATAKTLVSCRMRRSGSRWKTETGEHILELRALALSDRWDCAMDLLDATRRKSVRLAA